MRRALAFTTLTLSTVFGITAGCSDNEVDCGEVTQGQWAIQIYLSDDDGNCPYEGTVTLEGVSSEMTCGTSSGSCRCDGGEEFGTYGVAITNTDDGTTDTATILVEVASSPECVSRDADGGFAPIGGAGGGAEQGGAAGSDAGGASQ